MKRLRSIRLWIALGLTVPIVWLAGCTGWSGGHEPEPTVVLIGIDGFRWDFRDRAETPNLDRLVATGVTAERMIPSFPTKTFPNHYTMVTGLYPGNHGLVANNMWDAELDSTYGLGDRVAVRDGRWYGGEPIWVTAERAGLATAPHFWPGSEAEIAGIRPRYSMAYDHGLPHEERVDGLLELLGRSGRARASFATLYMSVVDTAAHDFDPDSAPQVEAAVREADAVVGRLMTGLERLGMLESTHLIVVSDHGMAATSPERMILIDDFLDLETVMISDWSPVIAIWPKEGRLDGTYRALAGAHPHLRVYRASEIPERFHYRGHRRIAPIIGIADEGWSIAGREHFERNRERYRGGTHGYDNQLVSMGALFIASGPVFKRGYVAPPFENVHLYPLMAHILGLEPAPSDGDLEKVRNLLR